MYDHCTCHTTAVEPVPTRDTAVFASVRFPNQPRAAVQRRGLRDKLSVGRWLATFALLWCVPAADGLGGQPARPEHRDRDVKAVGYRRWECVGRLHPRRSEAIDGSRWGVSCNWIADKHDQPVEQLAWLGVKWALLCPDWDRVETEKGKYNWNSPLHHFDDVFAGLVVRKIAPVVQVYGRNRLYMAFEPDPNQRPLADAAKLLDAPESRAAWHRLLEAMVARCHDRVRVWKIWNEPNHADFWKTKTTVAEYGRIVAEAAVVIRRVDPKAMILSGSTASVPLDYAEGFLAIDGADSFDHWSVHPYGELPEKQDEPIQLVQKLLRAHGKSSMLWQSECGFPSSADTGGWGFGGSRDDTKYAKWVLRRLLYDARLGMETSIYFVLNDYSRQLEGRTDRGKMGVNRKGLYAAGSWKPKPAAYAYRNLASLIDRQFEVKPVPITVELVDSRSFGQVRSESISTFTLCQQTTGSPLAVYWLCIPRQTAVAPGRLAISLEGQHLKSAALVDLLDGKVYRPTQSRDMAGMVRLESFPLVDSPLALCDSDAPATFAIDLQDAFELPEGDPHTTCCRHHGEEPLSNES